MSQGPDDGLRSIFRTHLRVGFHWTSVETGGTLLGVPDSNFGAEGVERWIEYKATDGWVVDLRPEQISWHIARHSRGGISYIIVRRRHDGGPRKGAAVDELWAYHGRYAMELRQKGLKAAVPCLGVWEHGPEHWDWTAVRAALLAPALQGG